MFMRNCAQKNADIPHVFAEFRIIDAEFRIIDMEFRRCCAKFRMVEI